MSRHAVQEAANLAEGTREVGARGLILQGARQGSDGNNARKRWKGDARNISTKGIEEGTGNKTKWKTASIHT